MAIDNRSEFPSPWGRGMGSSAGAAAQQGPQNGAVEAHEAVSGFLGDAASWAWDGASWLLAPVGRAMAGMYATFGAWADGARAYAQQAADAIGFWWTLGYSAALALAGFAVACMAVKLLLGGDRPGTGALGRFMFFSAAMICVPGTVLSYFGATHLGPLVAAYLLALFAFRRFAHGVSRSGPLPGIAYGAVLTAATVAMTPLFTVVTVIAVLLVVATAVGMASLFVLSLFFGRTHYVRSGDTVVFRS